MKTPFLSLCSLAVLLIACGGKTNPVDEEGCEHLQGGPSVTLTAVAVADGGTPPPVTNDHRRYDVTLPPRPDGTFGGVVQFAVSEALDYTFFLNADVPLSLAGPAGEVAFDSTAQSSEVCAEVKSRKQAKLAIGTHRLTFGPTPTKVVQLVIEEAAGGP